MLYNLLVCCLFWFGCLGFGLSILFILGLDGLWFVVLCELCVTWFDVGGFELRFVKFVLLEYVYVCGLFLGFFARLNCLF